MFKIAKTVSSRTSPPHSYHVDNVLYFDENDLREDISATNLRVDFAFKVTLKNGTTKHLSASYVLPTSTKRAYRTFRTSVKDEDGNQCGWISFDTRRLTPDEKATEDKLRAAFFKMTTAQQAQAKKEFAYQLGQAWGKLLSHYLSVYDPGLSTIKLTT